MTKRLVNGVGDLPQDLPPPRDLWPAISAAIEADKAAPAPNARRGAGWWPVSAVAAALVLVTLGVFIGRSIAPVTVVPVASIGGDDPNFRPTALQRDAEYRQQREKLLVEVQNRLKTMPAADRDKVSASLATLRRSIGEIEAALGHDPANALLQDLLVSSCQEEMRALTAVRDSGSQEI